MERGPLRASIRSMRPTLPAPWLAAAELHETHISRVYLIAEKAYKIKKPVRFPFLDYGTLERRRACCHAEVALNRRFAPDLYEGVVALLPDGTPAAEDDPAAVEYAVVM